MEQRINSGVLRKHDKAGVEARPDYKGRVNVVGKNYWLSGWLKENERGKFISLAVDPVVDNADDVPLGE